MDISVALLSIKKNVITHAITNDIYSGIQRIYMQRMQYSQLKRCNKSNDLEFPCAFKRPFCNTLNDGYTLYTYCYSFTRN